jgi:2-haloacid dehalogenase
MPIPSPKALIFDTFGTVVDWRQSLIEDLDLFGRAWGIQADWAGLVDAWRAAYQPSMDRVRNGERNWVRLDDLHLESLERLVGEFGIRGLGDTELRHLNRGWHRLRPWPDARPGLARLRRQFIIAPLSNGNVSLLLEMAKAAELPWDMIFGADLFRRYKPDRATYLGACKLLDLPPNEVMMVAAHNGDLNAARSLGLLTAFFPRPTEYGPHQSRDFDAEEDWDIVAHDIEDLATKLGA